LWLKADLQPPEIDFRFASNNRHSSFKTGVPWRSRAAATNRGASAADVNPAAG
jgi:hypothetical protein